MKASDDALYFAGPQRSPRGSFHQMRFSGSTRKERAPCCGPKAFRARRRPHQLAESSHKFELLTGKILSSFPRDRRRALPAASTASCAGGASGSTAVFDVTAKDPKMGVVCHLPGLYGVVARTVIFWGPWMLRRRAAWVISLGWRIVRLRRRRPTPMV
jgi:hypothetical protein